MKLNPSNLIFLKLLERSQDVGDGWRRYTPATARLVMAESESIGDLIELDWNKSLVRLTEEGKVVVKWLV